MTIFSFSKPVIYAQTQDILSSSTQVNLTDAIYADLAVRGYLDNVSVYYTDGTPTDDIKLNETRHWLPASTVKTYAAMYAYKLISEGKMHLNDIVTIDAKNDVPTELVTNSLPTLLIGDEVTIDLLIRQMITQSDNTAFNQLVDVLGRDNITAYIQSLGLNHSHVGSKLNLDDSQTQYEYDVPGYGVNTTTAEDYAKAFLLIKNNKVAGAKDLFTVLAQQKINNMIPLYLPKTVVCAHKTGDLAPLYHDGGICEDKIHSYVLTIFTNADDPDLLAHLSEITYTKNFQLVGQSLTNNQPLSQNLNQPLDRLVINPPKTNVLGASTMLNFPVPDITAADLGIKASDLSLVIPTNKLPNVFIPVDSNFHSLIDIWQFAKLLVAKGPEEKMGINLQTAQLRLAEAKDLLSRGKIQEAQAILSVIQKGLDKISKDPIIQTNASDQTAIQAISQTRFSLLGGQLEKTTGRAKLAVIKEIATQARETIQQVQPHIPEAISESSPTQRPIIGNIVNTTPTTITVKTAGGQQITIPTNHSAITVKQEISSLPSKTPVSNTLTVGTTIAIVGSTVDNHFSPSFILKNVPKELAAPEPVTVAKVDTKHNTLVVSENGVYTQVDISPNTVIKGADTNIPLKSIQPGDIVVVRGQPLTPAAQTTAPTPSNKPSKSSNIIPSISPTIKIVLSPTLTLKISPTQFIAQVSPKVSPTITSELFNKNYISPTIAEKNKPTTNHPSTASLQPKVIQGVTVEIIEKTTNAPKAVGNNTTQPSTNPSAKTPGPKPTQPTNPSSTPTKSVK